MSECEQKTGMLTNVGDAQNGVKASETNTQKKHIQLKKIKNEDHMGAFDKDCKLLSYVLSLKRLIHFTLR